MNMKIKITEKKEETREVEITLPYYCRTKDSDKFYKIYEDSQWGAIIVRYGSRFKSIETEMPSLISVPELVECTASEFTDAFNKVQKALIECLTKVEVLEAVGGC